MPLGVRIGARSPSRLLRFQIFICHRLKTMRGDNFGLGLTGGRVFTQPDAGVELFRDLADAIEIAFGRHAETHTAMFAAELVLKDKRPRSGFANPQPEPRKLIVKKNLLTLVGRQWRRGYVAR